MPFPLAAASAALSAVGQVADIWGAERDRKAQKQALQHTIRWRVADAKEAGIHPLFALGAQPMSVSPSYHGIGQGFREMGQDLSRAKMAAMDRQERQAAEARATMAAAAETKRQAPLAALEMERAALENDLLRSQIARLNSAQIGPGGANPFGPSAAPGTVVRQPSTPTVNAPGNVAREAGDITDYGYVRMDNGLIGVVPSADMKQRIEDTPQEWTWFWRNNMAPMFGGRPPAAPPVSQYPNRPGYRWVWSPMEGAFRERRVRSNGSVSPFW